MRNVLDEHRDIHARDCHMFEDVHLSESGRSICLSKQIDLQKKRTGHDR